MTEPKYDVAKAPPGLVRDVLDALIEWNVSGDIHSDALRKLGILSVNVCKATFVPEPPTAAELEKKLIDCVRAYDQEVKAVGCSTSYSELFDQIEEAHKREAGQ